MNFDFNWLPIIFSGIILIATFILVILFKRFFNRFILESTRIVQNDPTNYKFLKHTISAIIYIVGFSWAVFQIESLKVLASSLLAGAGILAVAVGFAAQAALGNVISGFFIIIFKPYRINDRITVRGNLQGVVEDITLRHTVIKDFNNRRIVIPNSIISNEVVTNSDLTDERICRFIELGISYDSDVQKAKQIMEEEALKHPLQIDNRSPEQLEAGDKEVPVRVLSYGDSSVNLRAWAWANNQGESFQMHCDLLENIKARFDAEGIEIPFPHRTLVMKNKITLEK